MGIYGRVPGKITEETLIGHIPRKISRFSNFYTRCVMGAVRQKNYRRSPLPQGRLEIPILLFIERGDSSEKNTNK